VESNKKQMNIVKFTFFFFSFTVCCTKGHHKNKIKIITHILNLLRALICLTAFLILLFFPSILPGFQITVLLASRQIHKKKKSMVKWWVQAKV
jgi:hypothetical protein